MMLCIMFLMIECSFWVFVFWLIVILVIVCRVFVVKCSFVLFKWISFWYCLIRVFFGFVRICIKLVLLSFFKVVMIGRCLINLGISLNFSRFFGMMCCKIFFLVMLLIFLELVLNLIVLFFKCFLMIVLILLKVFLIMKRMFLVFIWMNFCCGCLWLFCGGMLVIVFFRIFKRVCWIFFLEMFWVIEIFLFFLVILLILLM